MGQGLVPEVANFIVKLIGCSSLLVLIFRRNRKNGVVALGAVTVFLFFAFSLMGHSDLVNRPPWADKLVLSMAIFVAILAAVDVSRWTVGKRIAASGSIKRTVEFGLDAK
jgi:hypothetical protein